MSAYQARLEKMWDWMAGEGVALAMFEDAEGKRDSAVRWLTGQPGDALLFLSVDKKSALVPWDVHLAKAYAQADMVIPYNNFDRVPAKAIRGVVETLKIPAGSKIEIPSVTPYPAFLNYVGELEGFDVLCREKSASDYTRELRTVKDAEEIAVIRKAAAITNALIGLLEKKVRSGRIKTEADAAIFIELESRKRGCDGTAFPTLAAGPGRSSNIHAFPEWTDAPFGGQGLSILDFGVRVGGYNTDVTLTFMRDPSPTQRKMAALVETAASYAKAAIEAGEDTVFIAALADGCFSKAKKQMPHALGHGIGLDVHEAPFIKRSPGTAWNLQPGMFFSIEPGLYDPKYGGCRLENDFLITETGPEVLTVARIISL